MTNQIYITAIALLWIFSACSPQAEVQGQNQDGHAMQSKNKVEKSDEEWEAQLTNEEFYVLRKQGTERAFSGKFHDHHESGTYICAGCGNELFSSETKFESGTGWPSFSQPLHEQNVGTEVDKSHFMVRTEVHCSRCGGHLGHIFEDGPNPTGLRYCINSVSLDFKKAE